jgi:hypothetical protein
MKPDDTMLVVSQPDLVVLRDAMGCLLRSCKRMAIAGYRQQDREAYGEYYYRVKDAYARVFGEEIKDCCPMGHSPKSK